jgi:hypothetical protein
MGRVHQTLLINKAKKVDLDIVSEASELLMG